MRRNQHRRGVAELAWFASFVVACALPSDHVATAGALFEFGFGTSCRQRIDGNAGTGTSFEFDCVLSTSNNPDERGARAWSISIGVENTRSLAITTASTAADIEPNGLRLDDGFEKSEVTSGAGNEGAVSAVVLSFTQQVTLPPDGESRIAILEVVADHPAEAGACEAARVFFVDGRQGSAVPVSNTVNFRSQDLRPALSECTFEVCSFGEGGGRNKPYDLNDDGDVDLSDPVTHLSFLFLGRPPPACIAATDFNGDGVGDVSDPIAALAFLFLGGSPSPLGSECRRFEGCASSACD